MKKSHWSDSWIGYVIEFVGHYFVEFLRLIGKLIPVLYATMEKFAKSIIAIMYNLSCKRMEHDTLDAGPNLVRPVTIFVIGTTLILILILIKINVVLSIIIGIIVFFFLNKIWKDEMY